jgi:hypothetical protein
MLSLNPMLDEKGGQNIKTIQLLYLKVQSLIQIQGE